MATLYVIPNWDRDFENARSKEIERTSFFCVQNHFDGKKIRLLALEKKAVELYGAFHAFAAIASRCFYRGVLMDERGPMTARDVALKTGFPPRVLEESIEILSKPELNLIEKHEISGNWKPWDLPEAVRTWAVSGDLRRPRKSARGSPESAKGRQSPPKVASSDNGTLPKSGVADVGESPPESAKGRQSPPKVAEAEEGKGRVEKGTEGKPPTVPQGGRSVNGEVVNDFMEAKRIICSDILKGKDPGRPWSYEATNELVRLLPIPQRELQVVAWFHGLADDKETPELRDRRRSETTLVRFWSDEVTRAVSFREKNGAGMPHHRKKEPAAWREFFRWKYGDDVVLPGGFAELGADQRREWEGEHEAFEGALGTHIPA